MTAVDLPPSTRATYRPRRGALALATAVLVALAGCGGTDSPTVTTGTPPATPTTTAPPGGQAAEPATIQLSARTVTAYVGRSATLDAVVRDRGGALLPAARVAWSVADARVAAVDSLGTLRALAVGTTTVRAAAGAASDSALVDVRVVPVAAVRIADTPATLLVGASVTLRAAPLDDRGDALADRAVVWGTSDRAVAAVDTQGRVTALAPGVVTITATSEGRSDAVTLAVLPVPVARVVLSVTAREIVVGETLTLSASLRDSAGAPLAGRSVVWSSASPAVAAVTDAGVVRGVAPGVAVVSATVDGASASATITVRAALDLRLGCLPTALRVPRGSTSTVSCALTMPAARAGAVTFRGVGLPAGVRLRLLGADATPALRAGSAATVFLAADVDSTVAVGRHAGALRAEVGDEAAELPFALEVTPTMARVRMVYLIPADRTYDPQVAWGMERAVRHLQIFFQQQLGGAGTFAIHLPAVEVVRSPRPASVFAPRAFNGVGEEVFAALGGRYYDRANIWAVYFDVDPTSAVGGAASLATLPRGDVAGIAGRDPREPTSRWVGGLGHEIGHAMGLPHPPQCEGTNSWAGDCGSLMWFGYLTYPQTFIAASQKRTLTDSTYVRPTVTTTPLLFDPNVFGPMLVPAGGAARARGTASTAP